MAGIKSILPNCGLFRTTKPLPEHEAEVPANVLVYFHNHSDSGLPVVIVPEHNILNRWHFHGAGIPFRGLSWADTLVKLPAEGFYMLRKQLDFDGGQCLLVVLEPGLGDRHLVAEQPVALRADAPEVVVRQIGGVGDGAEGRGAGSWRRDGWR